MKKILSLQETWILRRYQHSKSELFCLFKSIFPEKNDRDFILIKLDLNNLYLQN